MKPQEALKILLNGNERFAAHKSVHPNRCDETRASLLSAQNPFAVVVSCSDSRVPVEIIFDVGLGDVFAVRTAGHVLSPEVLGSIEYAVKHLKCPLVMILGHTDCGAVQAAANAFFGEKQIESENLKALLSHLFPALEKIPENEQNNLDSAVLENVKYQVEDLKNKDLYLSEKLKNGEIILAGAVYDLNSGKVSLVK